MFEELEGAIESTVVSEGFGGSFVAAEVFRVEPRIKANNLTYFLMNIRSVLGKFLDEGLILSEVVHQWKKRVANMILTLLIVEAVLDDAEGGMRDL